MGNKGAGSTASAGGATLVVRLTAAQPEEDTKLLLLLLLLLLPPPLLTYQALWVGPLAQAVCYWMSTLITRGAARMF